MGLFSLLIIFWEDDPNLTNISFSSGMKLNRQPFLPKWVEAFPPFATIPTLCSALAAFSDKPELFLKELKARLRRQGKGGGGNFPPKKTRVDFVGKTGCERGYNIYNFEEITEILNMMEQDGESVLDGFDGDFKIEFTSLKH